MWQPVSAACGRESSVVLKSAVEQICHGGAEGKLRRSDDQKYGEVLKRISIWPDVSVRLGHERGVSRITIPFCAPRTSTRTGAQLRVLDSMRGAPPAALLVRGLW